MIIQKSEHESIPSQAKRLDERHTRQKYSIKILNKDIFVNTGVYQTSGDTELMVESVEINKEQNFLEVGCGTGTISICLAEKAKEGLAVDISELAVENTEENIEQNGIKNLKVMQSNVFQNVSDKFDVIVCNPPYTKHEIKDNIDRMFWDPNDEMKLNFFRNVGNFLKPDGSIYFGWADFSDINVDLPLQLAVDNGLKLIKTFTKHHEKGNFKFYVFHFKR